MERDIRLDRELVRHTVRSAKHLIHDERLQELVEGCFWRHFAHPLADRDIAAIASERRISINTVGNLAANAYRKLGVHGAAAAVHAHRDAHFYCGSRVDFGPIREHLQASRSTSRKTTEPTA